MTKMNERELQLLDDMRIDLPKTGIYTPHAIYMDYNLSCFEKMVLSEMIRLIRASKRKNGYCYATNKYFSVVFHKSKTQIINVINKLKKDGYIDVVYATNHITRRIYINNEKCFDRKEEYIK